MPGIRQWMPLSRELEEFTGGQTTPQQGYVYGGIPPKGANEHFTRKEDWAESVATVHLSTHSTGIYTELSTPMISSITTTIHLPSVPPFVASK